MVAQTGIAGTATESAAAPAETKTASARPATVAGAGTAAVAGTAAAAAGAGTVVAAAGVVGTVGKDCPDVSLRKLPVAAAAAALNVQPTAVVSGEQTDSAEKQIAAVAVEEKTVDAEEV